MKCSTLAMSASGCKPVLHLTEPSSCASRTIFTMTPLSPAMATLTAASPERQQRARSRNKRRSLIVVAVESAEGPVEMGYVESEAEARADRALGNSARKVRGTHACG